MKTTTILFLSCFLYLFSSPALAQDTPVEWILTAGSKGDDHAGGVNVAIGDGSLRFAATISSLGGEVGDGVFKTPERETAIAVEVDPKSGRPLVMYSISADDAGSSIRGLDVMVGAKVEVYLAGTYSGSIGVLDHDLGALDTPLESIYLAQFTEKGTVAWINTIGSRAETGMMSYGEAVSDQSGIVYLTGSYFGSNIIFINTDGSLSAQSPTGSDEDAFLALYDSGGAMIGSLIIGGIGDAKGNAVDVDDEVQVVFMGGEFSGEVIFGEKILISEGDDDTGFIAKPVYGAIGNTKIAATEWIIEISGDGNHRVTSVEVNPETGGGYFAGTYEGTKMEIKLDKIFIKSYNLPSRTGAFVGAFAKDGDIEWVSFVSGDAVVNELVYRPESPSQLAGVSQVGTLVGDTEYDGPDTSYKFDDAGKKGGILFELDTKGNLASLPYQPANEDGQEGVQTEMISMDLQIENPGTGFNAGVYNDSLGHWIVGHEFSSGIFLLSYNSNLAPPLPVELTSFNAIVDGNDALLTWTTASETNNAGFEILHRSANSAHPARAIHESPQRRAPFIPGAGTTDEPQSYAYRLENLAPGTHHFQLKQIDFDGTFAFSDEITVSIDLDEAFKLTKAFPNPFNPQASFSLSVAQAQEVEIVLYDLLGRQVQSIYKGFLEAQAAHQFVIDGNELPSGTYFYGVKGVSFSSGKRVVLLK